MSEAALTKIQNDCSKLEAEIQMYKNSQPLSTACAEIIASINSQPEPFSSAQRAEPNPWHSGGGSDGGFCTIS